MKPLSFLGSSLDDLRAFPEPAQRAEAIYVLHAFQKKTRATSKRDLDLARTRLRELA